MHPSAVLVGFLDQGNLGLGYVAAMLMQHGFAARIIDLREEESAILATLRDEDPVLVGFSIIFQYYVPKFGELASYLRNNGVTCHFTAGGHYPSLRYQEILRDMPELDSVVRFEGELTATELMQCLTEARDWHQVAGIAYRQGEQYVASQPRPLITDLDVLPYPARPLDAKLTALGRKASPILASRGCCRDCSFCSIRQFYGQVPGRKVRVRHPASVVQEMKTLHEENGTSIFLFQDDDFPVWGAFGRRWVSQFIESLEAADLSGRILWKISCRSDEVEPELFSRLRDAGLYMVYLGIESGNETGLITLNKKLTVDDNHRAVGILKNLGLAFGYGFMLFDPSSTFESVRANLVFLRRLTENGSAPVIFCRMLPYAGTPIEDQLRMQGRLRGSVDNPDYDFLDFRVGQLFEVVDSLVAHWIRDPDALAYQIGFAWLEYWIMRRLFPPIGGLSEYEHSLRSVTSDYNEYILRLVEDVFAVFEFGEGEVPSPSEVLATGAGLLQLMIQRRQSFILQNQQALLAALEPDAMGSGVLSNSA